MRVLRETFLSTFRAAVREAGALSVMPSYNEIDGVPSHASRWLLEDVLRGEWGFRGFTVSDYFAISELYGRAETFGHHVASDAKDAARLAVQAGVDVELPDPDGYPHLASLVHEGTIPESVIDDRVRPILRAKVLLRLFDDPYVDPAEAERLVREPSHRQLALEAAPVGRGVHGQIVDPQDGRRGRHCAIHSGVREHDAERADGIGQIVSCEVEAAEAHLAETPAQADPRESPEEAPALR